ncbi:hypothetical protein HK097_011288 [Rhizophlyctis rosea]|uniref:Uncharacterized protein n=1 Tax=Rhizophlyctis rosea TaxID=64517 RepID=A0AAD5S6N0_9FUNG|nr:hypothetical protein HK097_011288 [Rhizophlyctis rosea]
MRFNRRWMGTTDKEEEEFKRTCLAERAKKMPELQVFMVYNAHTRGTVRNILDGRECEGGDWLSTVFGF